MHRSDRSNRWESRIVANFREKIIWMVNIISAKMAVCSHILKIRCNICWKLFVEMTQSNGRIFFIIWDRMNKWSLLPRWKSSNERDEPIWPILYILYGYILINRIGNKINNQAWRGESTKRMFEQRTSHQSRSLKISTVLCN